MARVRTPLLSFGARGKLANTLVFFPWKGIDAVREYVVPTNPKTAAQTAHRAIVTSVVSAWRNYFTNAVGRAAWDRSATQDSRPLSGFNLFSSNAIKLAASNPDASFGNEPFVNAAGDCTFDMFNLDDGAIGDEAGNFEGWAGTSPSSLLLVGSEPIGAERVGISVPGDPGDVVYMKLRKDGYDRSGIGKFTLE